MRVYHYLFALLLGGVSTAACSYENAADIKPIEKPQVVCTDTVNVSYATVIRPLFQQNCATSNCHAANSLNNQGIDFNEFSEVKLYVQSPSSTLFARIQHQAPYNDLIKAMPQGKAKLADCDIQKIKSWRNQGCRNN